MKLDRLKYLIGFSILVFSMACIGNTNVMAAPASSFSFSALPSDKCTALKPLTSLSDYCAVTHSLVTIYPEMIYGYKLTATDTGTKTEIPALKGNQTNKDLKVTSAYAGKKISFLQTGSVQKQSIGYDRITVPPKSSNVHVVIPGKRIKCYAGLKGASGSGLSGAGATNWLGWDGVGNRRVYFLQLECDPNGGADCDNEKNNGQAWNAYSSTMPIEGYPAGYTTPRINWDIFGRSTYCKLKDRAGIDSGAPACVSTFSPTAWTNKNVTITTKCTDSQSGCAQDMYTYRYVGSNNYYTQYCTDLVGNTSSSTVHVTNIDKKKPTCGATTVANTSHYYNTPYKVSVGCSDPKDADGRASGCKASSYSANSTGNTTINIYDVAGNSTACTVKSDKYDAAKPTVKITLEAGQEGYNSLQQQTSNAQVVATITATDAGSNGNKASGVNKVCYKLSGATTKAETCVTGSSTTVTITATGKTTITAWAFDNAYDYNGGSPKWNGNRSADASKDVYEDKVNPTITFNSTPGNDWSNKMPTSSFTVSDVHSGVYTVEYVWAPTTNTTIAFRDYKVNKHTPGLVGGASQSYSSTAPKDENLSDISYLHVKVCDNAYSAYGSRQPNCITKFSGGYKIDIVNKSTITATSNSLDWTHVIKDLTFTATNDNVGANRSGLAKLSLYFDNNYPHTNTDINAATFNSAPDLVKVCSTDVTASNPASCTHAIDFSSLKSNPVQSGEGGAATEGVRYIKVVVEDLAGNKASKVFGPYKWDTTKSNFTSNVTPGGTEDGKFYVEK